MSDIKKKTKKKNRDGYANMGATVHARAAGWIEKQKRDRGGMSECEKDEAYVSHVILCNGKD